MDSTPATVLKMPNRSGVDTTIEQPSSAGTTDTEVRPVSASALSSAGDASMRSTDSPCRAAAQRFTN